MEGYSDFISWGLGNPTLPRLLSTARFCILLRVSILLSPQLPNPVLFLTSGATRATEGQGNQWSDLQGEWLLSHPCLTLSGRSNGPNGASYTALPRGVPSLILCHPRDEPHCHRPMESGGGGGRVRLRSLLKIGGQRSRSRTTAQTHLWPFPALRCQGARLHVIRSTGQLAQGVARVWKPGHLQTPQSQILGCLQ